MLARRMTRFGLAPPNDREVVEDFLDGKPFALTGSDYWNALGLGSTQCHVARWVYAKGVEGRKLLWRRPFEFFDRPFPLRATPEWYVVDLFNNRDCADFNLFDAVRALRRHFRDGVLSESLLKELARALGDGYTREMVGAL